MVDFDTYLSLFRRFTKIDFEVKPVLKPKRRYKNPVYQRLANRWYGMRDTGFDEVRIFTIPIREHKIRYATMDRMPRDYAFEASIKEESIELPKLAWQQRMKRDHYSIATLVDCFLADLPRVLHQHYEKRHRDILAESGGRSVH